MQLHLAFSMSRRFSNGTLKKIFSMNKHNGEKSYTSKAASGAWSQKREGFSPCYLLSGATARKAAKVSSLRCFLRSQLA